MFDQAFRAHLLKYGRSTNTADLYLLLVQKALEHPAGPVGRLSDRTLSAKYRHLTRSALRAWVAFTKDAVLGDEIEQVRLPPAKAAKTKLVLSERAWKNLRQTIDSGKFASPPKRAVLGMMACRGFRVQDVLRMKRTEVVDAVRTGQLIHTVKRGHRLTFGVTDAYAKYLRYFAKQKGWTHIRDLVSPRALSDREGASVEAIRRALEQAAKRTDLRPLRAADVHPHMLRATYATLYFEACGRDPKKLQAHMQWANIDTAMGYVVVGEQGSLDDIAAAMVR